MNTQPIDNSKKKTKEAIKNAATVAGAAVAGAGTVFAAEAVMDDGKDNADIVEPVVSPEPAAQAEPLAQPVEEPASDGGHGPQGGGVEQPVEPEPIDPTPVDPEPVEPEPVEPEPVDPEPVDPEPGSDPLNPGDIEGLPDVDPEVVAQTITSGDYVDPTDIDAPNISIAAVGTVETVDGEVLTAAQFTGDNGEQLTLIDVDGDNNYELIADASGNVVGSVPGTLTVSDSESLLAENTGTGGYMEPTSTDHISGSDDIADSIDQDIQTV